MTGQRSITPALRIRAAQPSDAATVHRTVLAAWSGTVDPRSSGHRLTEAEVAELITAGGGYVAELYGAPVGSVLWAAEGDVVELMKLAVVPSARGAGVAPALVHAVEALAARRSATAVLLAVSAYSPGLVVWYERLGYCIEPDAVYLHASPHSPPPIVLTRRL